MLKVFQQLAVRFLEPLQRAATSLGAEFVDVVLYDAKPLETNAANVNISATYMMRTEKSTDECCRVK